jgi:hypothetical protein
MTSASVIEDAPWAAAPAATPPAMQAAIAAVRSRDRGRSFMIDGLLPSSWRAPPFDT